MSFHSDQHCQVLCMSGLWPGAPQEFNGDSSRTMEYSSLVLLAAPTGCHNTRHVGAGCQILLLASLELSRTAQSDVLVVGGPTMHASTQSDFGVVVCPNKAC